MDSHLDHITLREEIMPRKGADDVPYAKSGDAMNKSAEEADTSTDPTPVMSHMLQHATHFDITPHEPRMLERRESELSDSVESTETFNALAKVDDARTHAAGDVVKPASGSDRAKPPPRISALQHHGDGGAPAPAPPALMLSPRLRAMPAMLGSPTGSPMVRSASGASSDPGALSRTASVTRAGSTEDQHAPEGVPPNQIRAAIEASARATPSARVATAPHVTSATAFTQAAVARTTFTASVYAWCLIALGTGATALVLGYAPNQFSCAGGLFTWMRAFGIVSVVSSLAWTGNVLWQARSSGMQAPFFSLPAHLITWKNPLPLALPLAALTAQTCTVSVGTALLVVDHINTSQTAPAACQAATLVDVCAALTTVCWGSVALLCSSAAWFATQVDKVQISGGHGVSSTRVQSRGTLLEKVAGAQASPQKRRTSAVAPQRTGLRVARTKDSGAYGSGHPSYKVGAGQPIPAADDTTRVKIGADVAGLGAAVESVAAPSVNSVEEVLAEKEWHDTPPGEALLVL